MGSSRLPGKSLRVLAGRPLIEHVLMRSAAISGVARVILATSTADRDTALVERVQQLGYDVLRGSEHDVLERYHAAAMATNADVIVRVTGDCPFLAPDVAEQVLCAYFSNPLQASYVSNDTLCSGYPDGTDVEVFSRTLLDYTHVHAADPLDREHVTRYMRQAVTTGMLKSDVDWSMHKLSVDRPEDYLYATRLAARLPAGDYSLATTMRIVLELAREDLR